MQLKSISAALHGVSSQIAEQSQKESSVQENRSKRLTEINAELIRLEEEQTKQLANLAKYTNRLKTMVIEKNSVEAAVRSLIVAVSCLKKCCCCCYGHRFILDIHGKMLQGSCHI